MNASQTSSWELFTLLDVMNLLHAASEAQLNFIFYLKVIYCSCSSLCDCLFRRSSLILIVFSHSIRTFTWHRNALFH